MRIDAPSVLRPRAFLADGPTLVLPWATGGSVEGLLARGAPSPRRAAEIVVRWPAPVPVEIDGDLRDPAEVLTFTMSARALDVCVPADA